MSQIRINQIHPEVFKLMSGLGVFDVDIEMPLTGGNFYTISTAIAATVGTTPNPTFIKFSVDMVTTEVWYYELEKPFNSTNYLNPNNWIMVLSENNLPNSFTPVDDGVLWWDTE
jgi:hypothetical protein